MAKKTTKKANPKNEMKEQVTNILSKALLNENLNIEDGTEYGFTKGTIVVHGETVDLQIKLITPKAGVERYEKPEDNEEE